MPKPPLTLIENANLFAPQAMGLQNILIGGGKVLAISATAAMPNGAFGDLVERIDVAGNKVIPGFIDAHTHITGGGGEAGFATRVPPVPLSHFTSAGVTTVVGLLGTDDLVRSTESVVAQVYALREEGLSAFCYTGGYHLPLTTLTGSVRSDIVFVDPIIAVGELAISDHRSSQPTLNELLKVAAEAHVAHLMTGKAGVVHLHLGDGARGLALVRQALDESEIPPRIFNPTHVNRRRALFEEACELTHKGCCIDITAFATGTAGYEPLAAVLKYFEGGFPPDKLTISSDGGGCLPDFDEHGRLLKMDFASSSALTDVFYQLQDSTLALETFLPCFTSNVAELLCLTGKGRIAEQCDADLLVLNAQGKLEHVMALGQWQVFAQQQVIKGTFE